MQKFIQTGAAIAPIFLFSTYNAAQEVMAQKPLNIVHIMTDDHSYQALSAYGHPLSKQAPTPNLDRLAAQGMLFRQAFVENSLSTPSRACLMTGLYSHQNGQRNLGEGIDTTKTFFSEILHEQGYQTGVVGKWHMQCEPKGFDYYHLLDDQGDYYNPEFKSRESDGKYIREEGYATTLTTDHAIDFLEHRDPQKPFCLLVHHKAPHRNWLPEPSYLNLYEEVEFPYPETFYDDYATRGEAAHTQDMNIRNTMTMIYDLKVDELSENKAYEKEPWRSSWEALKKRMTPEQLKKWTEAYKPRNEKFVSQHLTGDELLKWKYQRYIKDYMRCVKSVDDQVGRLLDYLDKEGLMDNTVIVYTSDQGFYMGEHGWFDKRFMYEESFRTPLIIRYPGKAKGSECKALVQNIDYAPTYLDIAGIEKPDYMVGTSLVPLLNGKTPKKWRNDLYYHYYDYPAVHYVRRHDGVRDERYKLIHFYGEKNERDAAINSNELYDLQNDPNELRNLYGDPQYQQVVNRLQKKLDEYRKELKIDEY